MKKKCKTRIFARAFCSFGTIDVKAETFLTIEEAEEYVKKNLTETAMVLKVIHFKTKRLGGKFITKKIRVTNKNYQDYEHLRIFKESTAKLYFNKKYDDENQPKKSE